MLRVQGYNRMTINATISTGQSLLELLGSVIVLMRGGGITAMGFVTVGTSGLAAIIGERCIMRWLYSHALCHSRQCLFKHTWKAVTQSAELVS